MAFLFDMSMLYRLFGESSESGEYIHEFELFDKLQTVLIYKLEPSTNVSGCWSGRLPAP